MGNKEIELKKEIVIETEPERRMEGGRWMEIVGQRGRETDLP